ncbi:hypothetical protein BDV59DRAFT_166362 [Aspergillus ambiguus]|uniref:uncharacterized protein n=1 Tax=Aspergillus ambiguus TaxID=176160 RepID=UPI003CCE3ACA
MDDQLVSWIANRPIDPNFPKGGWIDMNANTIGARLARCWIFFSVHSILVYLVFFFSSSFCPSIFLGSLAPPFLDPWVCGWLSLAGSLRKYSSPCVFLVSLCHFTGTQRQLDSQPQTPPEDKLPSNGTIKVGAYPGLCALH